MERDASCYDTTEIPAGKQQWRRCVEYNRDGKRGKSQIIIGLLTDFSGEPPAMCVLGR
jgi:hypothetical protein